MWILTLVNIYMDDIYSHVKNLCHSGDKMTIILTNHCGIADPKTNHQCSCARCLFPNTKSVASVKLIQIRFFNLFWIVYLMYLSPSLPSHFPCLQSRYILKKEATMFYLLRCSGSF